MSVQVGDVPKNPSRNKDGFMVEEDGLVDIRLMLSFAEDAKVRVTPEVAKRIMDGEFDDMDPAEIQGVDIAEILNLVSIEIRGAYEGRPERTTDGSRSRR